MTVRKNEEKIDFSRVIDRRHGNSYKWDVKDNELPMWVADMDFQTAPEIISAMQEKVATGVFGYEEVPSDYFAAVQSWMRQRHHVEAKPDWMIFCTGVVPAISSLVRRLTHAGDNVLIQAPCYNIFYNSIVNSGRHVLSSDLVYDEAELAYHVDYEDLEAKLADPLTNMMLFCNPHNPTGHIWTKDEVAKIASLCCKHHVKLVSDEIHGDITFNKEGYNSVLGLEDQTALHNVIALVSPSKTFNVAALHAATVIVPDANLRAQASRGLNSEELAEPNLLAIPGTIAAYEKGGSWLDQLLAYLKENRQEVSHFLEHNVPSIKWVPGEATYLMWLDVSALTPDGEKFASFLRETTGLYLTAGKVYGNGDKFVRMNVACPQKLLEDGLRRLQRGTIKFMRQSN